MSPLKSFFVGVIFGAAVCILAMKQATDEGESERELKKVAIEHDERF